MAEPMDIRFGMRQGLGRPEGARDVVAQKFGGRLVNHTTGVSHPVELDVLTDRNDPTWWDEALISPERDEFPDGFWVAGHSITFEADGPPYPPHHGQPIRVNPAA